MDRRPPATFVTKVDGGLSLGNPLSDLGVTTGSSLQSRWLNVSVKVASKACHAVASPSSHET